MTDTTTRQPADADRTLELEAILRTSPDAIWRIGEGGQVQAVNDATCALLGYSRDEMLRMRVSDVEVQEDEPAIRAHIERIRRVGSDRFESRHRCKDGRIVDVDVSVQLLTATPPVMVCFVRDITGRKAVERALRAREAKLFAYFNSPAAGVVVTENGPFITEVNDRFCAMLGYSREELLGKPVVELSHPDDADQAAEVVRRLEGGEFASLAWDKRYLRKDGSVLWARASLSCVRTTDGKPWIAIGIEQDITEQKRAEEALRYSEMLYRSVVKHYPNGMVGLFDDALRMVLHDGSRPGLLHDKGSVVGCTPQEFMPPGEAAQIEELFREALAGRDGRGEVTADGRVWEVSTYPIRDERGRVAMGMLVTAEVTEARAIQAQLQAAFHLATVGTLVAGVAHELNSPLHLARMATGSALRTLLDLRARAGRDAPLDRQALARELDAAIEALQGAAAGEKRIASTVADLSAFGRQGVERGRVRLRSVVDESLRWLRTSVPWNVRVRLEDAGAPDVLALAGQLGQVVINLVTTAARAIPTGQRGLVTVRIGSRGPDTAVLEVSSDGPGVPAEILERIFEPFFVPRESGPGKGLGLAICRSIVTEHGGTIVARSEPGKGSTFTVELPAAPPDGGAGGMALGRVSPASGR